MKIQIGNTYQVTSEYCISGFQGSVERGYKRYDIDQGEMFQVVGEVPGNSRYWVLFKGARVSILTNLFECCRLVSFYRNGKFIDLTPMI